MADSNWTEKPTSLSPCRRYICTHDPTTGKSVFHSSPAQIYYGRPGVGGIARSYGVSGVPANLTDDLDIQAYLNPDPKDSATSFRGTDIVLPNLLGANLVVVDLEPGAESRMHRTVSVDFSICVMGSIDMELDGGEKVNLRPGDHIIQRGTMHKWYNASKTEPARFVAVTLPCEPFEIPGSGGKMLVEEHVKGTGAVMPDGSRL